MVSIKRKAVKTDLFYLFISVFIFISFSCNREKTDSSKRTPVDYVNPYIGNISHLLVPTYPMTHLPNSMLRVQPNRIDYTFDVVDGLPILKTSHRGATAFRLNPVNRLQEDSLIKKKYVYDNEKITPYHYSMDLIEEDIAVEFAPSHQSAIYQLTFGQGNGNIILTTANGRLEYTDNAIRGYQQFSGNTKVYLYMESQEKPSKIAVLDNNIPDYTVTAGEGKNTALLLSFEKPEVRIRYGISYISIEQAKSNLQREIDTYNVETISRQGKEKWNEVLGKIRVEGVCETQKTVFYTALYRTYERMITISEDGKYYSPFDGQMHMDHNRSFYTDDWIWDTYRATHPLRTIIEPEMEQDMLNSFILMAQQTETKWLPTFPSVHGDSHGMNGNHGVITLWDAWQKGLRNMDMQAAFESSKKTLLEKSILPYRAVPHTELDKIYLEKGYFPALEPGEKESLDIVHPYEKRQSVAITLAACYDDWCLAQMAREMDEKETAEYFLNRSFNYRNIYNEQTGFFHPRNRKGEFIQPMDYAFSGGKGGRDYYDENNGWIYRWEVPQNIKDLIRLMGGKEAFSANLDETFRKPLEIFKPDFFGTFPDHTGLVGQYSMGNEPCLHIPYLYNYVGQPWKTQKRVRELLSQWFRNDLMGMPGDEDGRGMSAFVVFSSLGFYPVTPGLPMYVIGSPVFESATIELPEGKTFQVICHNYSPENKYIRSATLNGKEWNKSWFSHQDLMQGGKLEFVMGKYPNKMWASSEEAIPPSFEWEH
ncbi:MAG: GH92 family glycosyl hydrolase [Candidatus Azobacteroides sp.]|nr:GH92 family glycosyl hydrolase [Candidatus Azobacteroides sp.]